MDEEELMNEMSANVGTSSQPASAAPRRELTEEELLEQEINGGEDNETEERVRATHTSGGYKKRKSHLIRAEPQYKQDKRKKARLAAGIEEDGAGAAATEGDASKSGDNDKQKPRVASSGDAKEGAEGGVKLPKYKVALLLGFNGQGYNGMQYQFGDDKANVKTIESKLFEALVAAGAISRANSVDPKKVDLQRAARTDRGVSAAGNVVSLKMITAVPGCENDPKALTQKINEHLPSEIRLWGFTRTLSSFNARMSCDTRVYEYLFPSYVLLPPRPGTVMDKLINPGSEGRTTHPFWADYQDIAAEVVESASGPAESTEPITEEEIAARRAAKAKESEEQKQARRRDLQKKRAWRVSKEELDRFRDITQEYLGTHNFHNYTLMKDFKSRDASRYIISIDVPEPEIYGDIEWVSVKIHGQSFMLHQIRKMICMAILLARTQTPKTVIKSSFLRQKVIIPKAPALGLLLEQPRFGGYNQRVQKLSGQQITVAGEEIDFAPYADEIHAFKLKEIYEQLRSEEERTGVFQTWIQSMEGSTTTDFGYLNSEGKIPERAVKANAKEASRAEGLDSEDEEGPIKNDDEE